MVLTLATFDISFQGLKQCFSVSTTNLSYFTFHSYTFHGVSSNYFYPSMDQNVTTNLSSIRSHSSSTSPQRSRHISSSSSVFSPMKTSTPQALKHNSTRSTENNSNPGQSYSHQTSSTNSETPELQKNTNNLRIVTIKC